MSQSNEKSGKAPSLNLAIIPILLILSIWAFYKLAFYGNGRKATESLARFEIYNIIKYQREFYLKNNTFSKDSLEKVGLVSGSKYEFSVDVFKNKVIIFAKLKSKNPSNPEEFIKKLIYPDIVGNANNFVAGIFLFPPNSNSKGSLKVILCGSHNMELKELNPPFPKDGVPVCSENTEAYE